ncbi:MAG: TonB-dependent receptor, partial [Bacteroidota bacterium]
KKISRTGYTENQVADPNTLNYKLSGAIHYKISSKIEAIAAGYWGTGNTVYSGSQRYSLKNLKVGQYKLELKGSNWNLRGYTTQENSGESHNLSVATTLFNEAWKPSSAWYQQYAFAFLNAKQNGRPDAEAHGIARATADVGRPAAGSTQFKTLYDQVRKIPIPQGGLFLDRTDLYMVEGQYNFTGIKFAEVLVGGNWKKYVLNSQGTLFYKEKEPININEYGGYVQLGKEVVKDVLKLTGSIRYDKNENFEGRFTPRVTAVIKPAKDHNIRVSYQTAYRFPSTQQQFIDLNVGTGTLIGGDIELYQKYDLINNQGNAYNNGVIGEKIPYRELKPESVVSYELGYKTLVNKRLLIDAYGYYGTYSNFISRRDVLQVSTQKGFSVVTNVPEEVKTYGGGASIEYVLPANFVVGANFSSDKIKNVPAGFRSFFNAPDFRTVLSLSNTGFGKNKVLGFNIAYRYQTGFLYESEFIEGDVPAYHTIDVAFNVRIPKIKSMFKLGANNLLNQYYQSAIGNPSVGGLYYVSFAFNVL